jgi:hypothetical protein
MFTFLCFTFLFGYSSITLLCNLGKPFLGGYLVFCFNFPFLILLLFYILQIKLGFHLKKLLQKLWPTLKLPRPFKTQESKQQSWMYVLPEALF